MAEDPLRSREPGDDQALGVEQDEGVVLVLLQKEANEFRLALPLYRLRHGSTSFAGLNATGLICKGCARQPSPRPLTRSNGPACWQASYWRGSGGISGAARRLLFLLQRET